MADQSRKAFEEAKKKNPELTYCEFILKGKTPTEVIKIEGVGTVEIYGKMDMEKMVKRLLESNAIMNR
jgi:hypothetical protein